MHLMPASRWRGPFPIQLALLDGTYEIRLQLSPTPNHPIPTALLHAAAVLLTPQ